MNIILALVIFSMIILFHELGHFLLAKFNDVKVNEFCLGLGPTLVGFTKGETRYSLKLLPFGGACMMEGVLTDVTPGYPAQEAGMQAGDEIVKLGNKPIHLYREVSVYTYFHANQAVEVTYKRNGKKHETVLTPKLDEESGRYLFGFYGTTARTKGNFAQTLQYTFYEVKYWITSTVESLGQLVRGRVGMNDMSGPVGIVKTIGDTYTEVKSDGVFMVFLNMLNICILLSANLGVMNLLPIPALDGGRIVFLAVEALRGRRMDPNKEGAVNLVFLMLLMVLMVVIMFNDIRKIVM